MVSGNVSAPTYSAPSEYAIIGDNSFLAVSTPLGEQIKSYGAIIAYNDDLEGEVRKQYPELFNLIQCESGFNPNAWNKDDPNDGSKGLLQFQQATFDYYAELLEIKNPDILDINQQLQVASYLFSIDKQNLWTCWKSGYN